MTVTLLQLSDTHFTSVPGRPVYGSDPEARLAAVLAAWDEVDDTADLVLLTGDNADDGSAEAYERLGTALSVLGAPVLALPGNHDVAARMWDAFGGAPGAMVELGAWQIVGLDSSLPGEIHGGVDAAAVAQRLDELDDRPTVVAIHHPPVSRSTHPWFRLEGAPGLLAALGARPHVRALVSGHLHDAFDFEGPGGLALLGCPSTLAPIGHEGDRQEIGTGGPTGARVLHLEDDGTFSSTVLVA